MLSFMCFSTLWGFGNVLNGFVYFNGTQVIFSWILMFALYFVPYALMVGELGSAFKNSGGGVSSWILMTNILVPARVASFFNGFKPRLATQQKNSSTAKVTN